MAFQDVLATAAENSNGARTESDQSEQAAGDERVPDVSPFSMNYQTEQFDVDDDAVANGLRLLIAITNIL